ncbi:hypothetical protein BGZ59_003097, partial [Podila verticillata]
MTTVSEQQSTVQEQETKKQKEEKKVFQQFRGKDKAILEPEPPVRAHPEGDEYYVYWADIQDAFSNIDHLEKFLSKDDDTTTHGLRVLFKTEPYNGFERLSTPLRVKYSMNPHTVITREDLYDASSDVVALGTHQNRVELDRYMQEQEQFLSWVRETKTADPEVLYQTYLSQDAYRKDTDRRYASVLNPNPFIRLIRMFQGDRDIKQFYVERIYGLSEPLWCLDFADPRLFLVLPSDLGAWDDNDVTTHNFRLCFLCDFKYRKECDHKSRSLRLGSEIQPRHIHLSGHRGYDLKRSDEFFDKFGHFALEILKVVKDGFLDEYCSVPSLNTFRILECCEDTIIQHHLTRDNIEQLVDKSIAHIQQQQSAMDEPWSYMRNWLPKRYRSRVWMNGPETRQIRRFLHVPESDSGLGDLLQTLYTNEECPARWLCPGHAFEHSNLKCINDLIKLHGNQSDLLEANKAQHWRVDLEQGGVPKWTLRDPHVDVQRGTIAISLYTPFHAKIFASDLKNTKRTFDLSIRLAWGPTRKEIQTVLSQLVECNIRFLEIDASNLDALHHNPMEYTRDLFQGLERVGRILAKVVIHKDPEMAIRIMEWNCSYVPRAMVNHPAVPKKVTQHGDNDAMISTAAPQDHSVTLEKATVHDDRDAKILSALARDRPGDLENFTLRISLLSDEGLACIPQVLRQAKIQHLTIECMAFDASREALLGQALGAVQWLMIKSLTLFGSNINTWIQLWAQHSDLNECVPWDHELLWLGVIGTELPKQELSHASVMWLHNAIYLLSPVETHIESIHMEGVDWRLVE